jgi:hypothetical protein
MRDNEVRGRLLKHFYELHRINGGWVPTTEEILSGPDYVGPNLRQIIASVCQQLADAGEIKWEPFVGPNEGHVIGRAIITGHGVDVFERSSKSSIDIRFPDTERSTAASYLAPARSTLAPALTAADILSE